MISAWISLLERTLSIRLFSTFRILPRSGRIAWVERSRAETAEPPAESPSTTNSSDSDGSLIEQSASFPGSVEFSSSDLRRVRSRALRAAARACAADTALRSTARASCGFSSRNSASRALTTDSTNPAIPGLPSLVLVWPSNCGSVSFAEITAVNPSRTSSPERLGSFSRSSPCSRAYRFSTRVNAERKPDRCEPPSIVLMLLANENTDSW